MAFTHCPLPNPLPELEAVTGETGRVYTTPSGARYNSITTVLHILSADAIEKWRQKVGVEVADAKTKHASERGTAVHEAIEMFLKNQDISQIDPFIKTLLNRARLTLRRIGGVVAQEVPLYSDALEIAGRCDAIAEFDGVLSVIDFKTADRVKLEAWIEGYFQQATGYALMWEERTGICIKQIVIIIVGEDNSCQVWVKQRDDYVAPLRSTIARYRAMHGLPALKARPNVIKLRQLYAYRMAHLKRLQ